MKCSKADRLSGRAYFKALMANSVTSSGVARFWLGETLRHHLWMAHDHRCRPERAGGNRRILLGKFARSDALPDDFLQQPVHGIDMLFDHMPVALDGDDNHLVDLFVIKHGRDDQLILSLQVAAQAVGSADRQPGNLIGLLIAAREHAPADRLMDFGLGSKETIDIGGRHAEIARDIGDIGLGVAVMPEQPLRRLQNPADILLPRTVEDVRSLVHGNLRFTTDEF